ncbi:MAG: TetR/AcrR family transcriptional regulator [Brevinematales bacterium]|jgi:AcrR family transcriptional regulator
MSGVERSVRDKILNATLACIEKEGLHSVRIRSIAGKAGVNSAAINYYFGSKKKLIDEALALTMKNAIANYDILGEEGKSDIDKIIKFFSHNFDGVIDYPEIVKAWFYTPFTEKTYEPETFEWLKTFFEIISENVKKFHPENDEREIKLAVIQILSVMIVPSIFPGNLDEFTGLSMKKPETRKAYIDMLIKRFFK